MHIINLYRYKELDDSITITPNRRNETDETHKYRIVSDEGKILINGKNLAKVVDVFEEDIKLWKEIDDIYSETDEETDIPIVEEIDENQENQGI